MPAHSTNPYTPPEASADRGAHLRVVGHLAGVIGFLIGLAPTMVVVISLIEMWNELASSAFSSVPPAGVLRFGLKWLAINVFFCLPLSCGFAKVAKRFGSQPGQIAALSSTVFFPLPIIMVGLAPFIALWGTGSSLGT